ncbi:MAG: hypothetical protein RIM72_02980 [Alphaproteobacteria bacterium]
MDKIASLQVHDDDDVKNTKRQRWYDKEIDGCRAIHVIPDERLPCLIRVEASPWHIARYCCLAHIEAKFQQLAMNAWCTPQGVLGRHLLYQYSDLMCSSGPTKRLDLKRQ